MNNISIKLMLRLLLARAWRNMKGPIIEVEINKIYDRQANLMSRHELLNLFSLELNKGVDLYREYNKKIYDGQEKDWLIKFIGYSKKIPYWVTPWGGCVKDYSKRNRLTGKYSEQYVSELGKNSEDN